MHLHIKNSGKQTKGQTVIGRAGGVTTPAYVGFIGEEGENGVRRAYPPATLKRLVQVKRRYDPDNLFHLNLNIARHESRLSAS